MIAAPVSPERRKFENAVEEKRIALLDEYDRLNTRSDLYEYMVEMFLDKVLTSIRKRDGGLEMATVNELPEIAAKELARKLVEAEL